jgi:hypothetical protein
VTSPVAAWASSADQIRRSREPENLVYTHRKQFVYAITETELDMLRGGNRWSRRRLINRIISECESKP